MKNTSSKLPPRELSFGIFFRWKSTFLLSCLLYTLHFSLTSLAASEFKIITLQHRLAEQLLPIIQPLAGEGGVVTGLQNQLIIRADSQAMLEIEQAVKSLDVARRNIKITVRFQNAQQDNDSKLSIKGNKRFGNVAITTNTYPTQPANTNAQVIIKNNQFRSSSHNTQFLNVIDGERAFIRVGQFVPFTQEWVHLYQRYISVQKTTAFIEVTTGFAVRPHQIGEKIEVEITPRIARINQVGFIDFEELTTVVTVNPGEWLDLGNIMRQKDEVSQAILGLTTLGQSQSDQLSILVE